jgi:hypothetical protein
MYLLTDFSGIFADACVARSDKSLAFMSVFGRDTAMQQLRAGISLAGHTASAYTSLTFSQNGSPNHHSAFKVLLDNNKYLNDSQRTKVRLAPFGTLAQCFIVDERCLTVDKANTRATLLTQGRGVTSASTWATICELSPVPLLDHWQEAVLQRIPGICTPLVSIGKVSGVDISLPDDFEIQIGALVKQRVLTLQ